jgi:hypothetical protein
MSLDKEYGSCKIGVTKKKTFTTAAVAVLELITYNPNKAFTPCSFAVRVSWPAYVRQGKSQPADMTLEFELCTSAVWRVDVEDPDERYLYVQGTIHDGYIKVTSLDTTTGTSTSS